MSKSGYRKRIRYFIKDRTPLSVLNVTGPLRMERDPLGYLLWRTRLGGPPILKRPIFIVGCPRGGTTVFVDLFSRHPHVANWSEAALVFDPRRYYDPRADHERDERIATIKESNRLHAHFEYFRVRHGKQRFVNKHPRNSVRIRYLKRIFPDAFFVHVIRDGRAVVNSIINKINREAIRRKIPFGNFCKPPGWRRYRDRPLLEQAAIQWSEITRNIGESAGACGADLLELSYEELCRDTRGVLARAFKHAELDAGNGILQLLPKTMESKNNKYRTTLTNEEIATITRIQEEMLVKYGYTLEQCFHE
jgi:hypothetical protein